MFRKYIIFRLIDESFLPKNAKILYSSIPLSKNVKTLNINHYFMKYVFMCFPYIELEGHWKIGN